MSIIRRPNVLRTELESMEDFQVMTQMRQSGATWEEITEALNDIRAYVTTVASNRRVYLKLINTHITDYNTKEAAEEEKLRLLDDVEWVMTEAQRAWQKLKHTSYVEEISGRYGQSDDTPPENDPDDIDFAPTSSKKFSKKKVGIIEQHHAKYLDIVLKCVEIRSKVAGIDAIDAKAIDLMDVLKNRVLDDGGGAVGRRFASEDDVLDVFDPVVDYRIEENIELNVRKPTE